MKFFIKQSLFFIVVLESMLWVKDSINSNVIFITDDELVGNVQEEEFIFIGDSYAEVDYLDSTYVELFAEKGIILNDLSRNGMEWESIKEKIAVIENKSQKDLLLFIQIGDFINYRNKIYQASMSSILKNLKTPSFLKNIGHHLSFLVYGTPLYGTNFYKYCMKDYSINESIIEEEILTMARQFDKVYVLINYPFYAPSKHLRTTSVYKFYNVIAKNPEINHLAQSIDIVEGGIKSSVSWQNGHPNQRSVVKISEYLFNIIKEKPTNISADGF